MEKKAGMVAADGEVVQNGSYGTQLIASFTDVDMYPFPERISFGRFYFYLHDTW